jgi:hypothetical protein
MLVGKRADRVAACDAIAVPAFKAISGCEAGIDCAIHFSSGSHPAKKGIVTPVLATVGHPGGEWFKPWRRVADDTPAGADLPALQEAWK